MQRISVLFDSHSEYVVRYSFTLFMKGYFYTNYMNNLHNPETLIIKTGKRPFVQRHIE